MGKNTSIILGEYYEEMIEKEMNNGKYSSASEMIREGLRLLDERIKKIDAINKALIVGEESGKAQDYNYSAFIKKMAQKHKANA